MKWTKIAISDDINPIEECHEKTVMKNIWWELKNKYFFGEIIKQRQRGPK